MAAMEGLDRAHSHRSGGRSRSEFFICFTARPSSSSAASGSAAIRVPSSKSLMSPGRGRDPGAPSLSASLSRRLRSSGSVKGGQSPMFPAGTASAAGGGGGRRKGSAFEAVEPSSPKVTCIGQVRVKTKKKKGKGVAVTRSRSGREASFRRTSEMGEGERECMPQRNQNWVYQLPLSICEALRALGSEFNCLVPCRGGGRSPCSSSRGGQGKGNGVKRPRGTSSCGAVFARWLMAIEEEGEEGERGGEVVGLVVERREKGEVNFLARERDAKEVGVLEIEDLTSVMEAEKKEEVVVVEAEEEGRVSVCIPPRNALLLMRCRSDPVRVAALADRFWGSAAAANAPCEDAKGDEDDGNAQEQEEEEVAEALDSQTQGEVVVCSETAEGMEKEENAARGNLEGRSSIVEIEEKNVFEEKVNEEEEEEEEVLQRPPYEKETGTSKEGLSAETFQVQRKPSKDETEASEGTHLLEGDRELKDDTHVVERETKKEKGRRSISCSSSKAKEAGRRRSYSYKDKERKRHSFSSEREARRNSFSSDRDARRASFSSVDREGKKRWSFSLEKEELAPKDKVATPSAAAREETNIKQEFNTGAETRVTREVNKPSSTGETQVMAAAENEEEEREEGGRAEKSELPDCLMLMMYEPKLSMEVSKETWVCSTDFLHHPQYQHRPQQISKIGGSMGGDDDCSKTKVEMAPAAEPTVQPAPPPPPPLATAPPTASAIEQMVMGSDGAPVSPAAPPAYGPFVLTRCKSEPMRSSASLAPDACFWKSRHRPIGAAGIGF